MLLLATAKCDLVCEGCLLEKLASVCCVSAFKIIKLKIVSVYIYIPYPFDRIYYTSQSLCVLSISLLLSRYLNYYFFINMTKMDKSIGILFRKHNCQPKVLNKHHDIYNLTDIVKPKFVCVYRRTARGLRQGLLLQLLLPKGPMFDRQGPWEPGPSDPSEKTVEATHTQHMRLEPTGISHIKRNHISFSEWELGRWSEYKYSHYE